MNKNPTPHTHVTFRLDELSFSLLEKIASKTTTTANRSEVARMAIRAYATELGFIPTTQNV